MERELFLQRMRDKLPRFSILTVPALDVPTDEEMTIIIINRATNGYVASFRFDYSYVWDIEFGTRSIGDICDVVNTIKEILGEE